MRFGVACVAFAFWSLSAAPASAERLEGWRTVMVGVYDIDVAMRLWVDTFGFEVVERKSGPDPGLAKLWQLEPTDIVEQALLRAHGSEYGMLHLVEWSSPGAPVRGGSEVYDLVPKNLDIYVDDLPRRWAELVEKGFVFRTQKYSEIVSPDGTQFREIHLPVHDDINVVLLEVVGTERPFTDRGFAGVGPLIFIVPDAAFEKRFFDDVMQLDKLNDNLLQGPEIEKMIGLPPGAGLDVSIWGRPGNGFGEMEIIEYQGVRGRNLYPLAKPESLGVLLVTYVMCDSNSFIKRLRDAEIQIIDNGSAETIGGVGINRRFQSPAGLGIEFYESSSYCLSDD